MTTKLEANSLLELKAFLEQEKVATPMMSRDQLLLLVNVALEGRHCLGLLAHMLNDDHMVLGVKSEHGARHAMCMYAAIGGLHNALVAVGADPLQYAPPCAADSPPAGAVDLLNTPAAGQA